MKFYSLKKLINGERVNPMFAGKKLAACPDKYLEKGDIQVSYGGSHMTITKDMNPLTFRVFENKFGPGTYRLMYYEWNPVKK